MRVSTFVLGFSKILLKFIPTIINYFAVLINALPAFNYLFLQRCGDCAAGGSITGVTLRLSFKFI
jgi:hypothetical protein